MICLLFARGEDWSFGRDGELPWGHIPRDMGRFSRLTKGNPVYAGRSTFESIQGGLPDRRVTVFSQKYASVRGCKTMDYEIALGVMRRMPEQKHMVIGGVEALKFFAPHADRIYMTTVFGTFAHDRHLPHDIIPDGFEAKMLQYWAVSEKNKHPLVFANFHSKASA